VKDDGVKHEAQGPMQWMIEGPSSRMKRRGHAGCNGVLAACVAAAWTAGLLVVGLAAPRAAYAQADAGPVPVGVTAAREAPVRPTVSLTGTVISRTNALIASEVAGLVVALEARDGDTVARGAPIVRLRRKRLELALDAAHATLREAEARRDLAQRSRARNRELFESGVISRQNLDNAISEADAWQGRVDQARAEIARLEDDLERSVVRAPFTGVVVAEHCQVGTWLAVGAPVVEMLDLALLEVVVEVPERHYAETRIGARPQITFAALPELVTTGRVTARIPRADPQARTFPVKIRIDNPGGQIGVGMLATVALPAGVARAAILVPKDAVIRRGDQRLVFVVQTSDEGTPVARLLPVTLGASAGAWVAVHGIEAGASIITRGNERLRSDTPVAPEPVEYSPP